MKDDVIRDSREIGHRFGKIREALENGLASALAHIMPNETPRPQANRVVVTSVARAAEQTEMFPKAPAKPMVPTTRSLAKRQTRAKSHNNHHSESRSWIEHSLPNENQD